METIITNTVASVLDQLEIKYRQEEDEFTFKCGEDDGDFTYCVMADEENELLTVIGYFPVYVPKESMDRTCRVINDINDKTLIGAFAVDPEDRRPAFRLANYVCGGSVNERIVQMCLLQVMGQVNHSFQAIAKAMYGGEKYSFTIVNDINQPKA